MKHMYWIEAAGFGALAGVYYSEGEMLLAVLWAISCVVSGIIAVLHD